MLDRMLGMTDEFGLGYLQNSIDSMAYVTKVKVFAFCSRGSFAAVSDNAVLMRGDRDSSRSSISSSSCSSRDSTSAESIL